MGWDIQEQTRTGWNLLCGSGIYFVKRYQAGSKNRCNGAEINTTPKN